MRYKGRQKVLGGRKESIDGKDLGETAKKGKDTER